MKTICIGLMGLAWKIYHYLPTFCYLPNIFQLFVILLYQIQKSGFIFPVFHKYGKTLYTIAPSYSFYIFYAAIFMQITSKEFRGKSK